MRNRGSFDRQRHRRHPLRGSIILAVVLVIVCAGSIMAYHALHTAKVAPKVATTTIKKSTTTPKSVTSPPAPSECVGNDLSELIIVSISQRHLWACEQTKQVYDSAVVTGMENLPADLTPTGTYHIYAKQTNLYLNGSDSTGSWHDYVYYWMPFLSNEYGVYGFHDATWRPASAFGNISPYASNASHGCVELPLATSKWLYNWASVGTTLTIKS